MTRREIDLRLAGLELGTLLLKDRLDRKPKLARKVRDRIEILTKKREAMDRPAKVKAVRT